MTLQCTFITHIKNRFETSFYTLSLTKSKCKVQILLCKKCIMHDTKPCIKKVVLASCSYFFSARF